MKGDERVAKTKTNIKLSILEVYIQTLLVGSLSIYLNLSLRE